MVSVQPIASPQARFLVTFQASDSTFKVVVMDRGEPFDPLTYDNMEQELSPAMPSQEGGYGILVVKMVMDELHYERKGDCNVLEMTKYAFVPAAADPQLEEA